MPEPDHSSAMPIRGFRDVPPRLYHATRRSNLDSILSAGLLTTFYGSVHGGMDYRPAGPSIYLSRHETSNNLNGRLFDNPADPVIVLQIDASTLDPELFHPDEALFHMIDEDYLSDVDEDDPASVRTAASLFCGHFSIPMERADRLIRACLSLGEDHYPSILREMWPEYLAQEGEIAYLGDVPASAVLSWAPHPASSGRGVEHGPEPG